MWTRGLCLRQPDTSHVPRGTTVSARPRGPPSPRPPLARLALRPFTGGWRPSSRGGSSWTFVHVKAETVLFQKSNFLSPFWLTQGQRTLVFPPKHILLCHVTVSHRVRSHLYHNPYVRNMSSSQKGTAKQCDAWGPASRPQEGERCPPSPASSCRTLLLSLEGLGL